MREIHLLENNDACARFVVTRTSQGFSPETFLGIGVFSSVVPISGKGLAIRAYPMFFENEITESVIHGYFSAFERESLLMQVSIGEVGNFPISRWFLVGQHLSIFYSPKINVKRYLPTNDLLSVRSIEEFMQVYLCNLFPHIQEIRAQSILYLFDAKMICDYIKSFFIWLSAYCNISSIKEAVVNCTEQEIQKKVSAELLWFLSDSALHPCIAVLPSTASCFQDLIQAARNICIQGNLSKDLLFKL